MVALGSSRSKRLAASPPSINPTAIIGHAGAAQRHQGVEDGGQ